MFNWIQDGDTREWGRSNIVQIIMAENFVKYRKIVNLKSRKLNESHDE
jgi:hypothetical protein